MGFEKAILSTVEDVLQKDNTAGFTCGTLFVNCSNTESTQLLEVLQKDYSGLIIKSGPIQGEFAYDFC